MWCRERILPHELFCFCDVVKRRKTAATQRQSWDTQWVTGCAPSSPLLLCVYPRAAGAPGTCHTDSHLTNRGPGPLRRQKRQQPKSTDEERTPTAFVRHLHLERPTEGSALRLPRPETKHWQHIIKVLHILFCWKKHPQEWTPPKTTPVAFRHRTLISSTIVNEGEESVTVSKTKENMNSSCFEIITLWRTGAKPVCCGYAHTSCLRSLLFVLLIGRNARTRDMCPSPCIWTLARRIFMSSSIALI